MPYLPGRPEWAASYWQAWQADQPDPRAEEALAAVRALRAAGRDDEAFLTACQFLDAAARAAPILTTEQTGGRWPALVALLVEEVIGVTWSDEGIRWALRLEPPVGLLRLETASAVVSLAAEADTGAGIVVAVETTHPIDLAMETPLTVFQERVPAGKTRYLLTYLDRTDIVAAAG